MIIAEKKSLILPLLLIFLLMLILVAQNSSARGPDINDDGVVDIFDLVMVANQFETPRSLKADLNRDGEVNVFDLVLVALDFGRRLKVGIEVGDIAPPFELVNFDEKRLSLEQFYGRKKIVLAFYRGAW